MKLRIVHGVSLAFMLMAAVPVFAQDQPSADDIVSKMQSQLNLTADQVNAIKPIVEDNIAKRQALKQSMQDGTADKSTIRSQMEQLKQDENQKLSQTLTPDQMTQWNTMQSQMHQGHKHTHSSDESSS